MNQSINISGKDKVVEWKKLHLNVNTGDLYWEEVEDPINVDGDYAPAVLGLLMQNGNRVVPKTAVARVIEESSPRHQVSSVIQNIEPVVDQLKIAQRHIRTALQAFKRAYPGFAYELETKRNKGWRLVERTRDNTIGPNLE